MKKVILAIIALVAFGCSKDDDKEAVKELPEKFDIKVEVKGERGNVYKIHIEVSGVVKEWGKIDFPFERSHTYYTKGDEIFSSGCKCITISSWAYISSLDKLESFNLYVDGKLVDSTNIIAPAHSDGTIAPTILEYVYNP